MNINSVSNNMIPRLNQEESSEKVTYTKAPIDKIVTEWLKMSTREYEQRTAAFWAWHPFGRGIATGIISTCLTNLETPFRTGGLLGVISGLYNITTRPLTQKLLEKNNYPGVKGLSLFSQTLLPWAAAAMTMQQLHIKTGKPIFKMTTGSVVINTLVVSVFGYANDDLWKNKV